ncbi:MAG: VCBS repeat-containing protein [Planctomycetaceae bacterium]|nr:VCBS repeat-containing protein [Planctomycetaceae bacterium]
MLTDENGNRNPDEAGENDVTHAIIGEEPIIGLATSATVTGHQVTLDYYGENLGNVTLSSLDLVDNLDAVFGAGNYSLTSAPVLIDNPGTLTLNPTFNGSTNVTLFSAGTLAIGRTFQLRLIIDVTTVTDVGFGVGAYRQQAFIMGQGPSGTVSGDFSVNGGDPDPNGNGSPADPSEDAITSFFLESSSVGVAVRATVNGQTVTLDYFIENLGNTGLDNFSLPIDLDSLFGTGNYTIVGAPIRTSERPSFVLNPDFDGILDFELIQSGSLPAGVTDSFQIVVSVDRIVDMGSGKGVYSHQVTVQAQTPSMAIISDLSDSGTFPDPNGNGSADDSGEEDPTVIDFGLVESLVVTTLVDEDNGTSDTAFGTGTSLREAIAWANANPGSDTITFAPGLAGKVLTLWNGWSGIGDTSALMISSDVTIQGPVMAPGLTLAVDSKTARRHFDVSSMGRLTLNHLTLTGGNVAGSGGAIRNAGELVVSHSTLSGNSAGTGGAIFSELSSASLSIHNSTIAENSATIAAAIYSGAIASELTHVTIVDNTSGPGSTAYVSDTNTALLINVILSRNTDGTNPDANFSGINSGLLDGASGNNLIDVPAAQLLLGGLGDNGGSTQTVALMTGSPAINAGMTINDFPADQRGMTRVGISDIGAYEAIPVVLSVPGSVLFTENDPAVIIADSLVVTPDQDATPIVQATLTLTNFVTGQDVLGFINDGMTMGNITVVSNMAGALTLASAGNTATLAEWQAALRAVTYQNTSDSPDTTTRTIEFVLDDGTTLSNTLTSSVMILAVNDTPTDITLSNNSIAENAGMNAVIGNLTAVDPDGGDMLTFSLPIGLDDNSRFHLSGNSLRANGSFDFETQNSFTITIRVTDQDNETYDEQFTINITDVTWNLTLSILPTSATEGGTATGTVTRDGDLSQPSLVMLNSGDVSEASVPVSVMIPAGMASATFQIQAVDESFADGTRQVTITATALDAAAPATSNLTLLDNDSLRAPDDLVFFDESSRRFKLGMNTGNSFTWFQTNPLPVTIQGYDSFIGDFDGDGDLDAAVRNRDNTNVNLYRNNGDGTLTGPILFGRLGNAGTAKHFQVGDYDGNGRDQILWLYTDGKYSGAIFSRDLISGTSYLFTANPSYDGFITGDFNGDGFDDLVGFYDNDAGTRTNIIPFFSIASNNPSLLRRLSPIPQGPPSNGPSLGSFGASIEIDGLTGFRVADLDGDGRDDLIAVTKSGQVLHATATGTMAGDGVIFQNVRRFVSSNRAPSFDPALFTGQFLVGLFDDDERSDLFTVDNQGGLVVSTAGFNAAFLNPVILASPGDVYGHAPPGLDFTVGDFDGDGYDDVVALGTDATVFLSTGDGNQFGAPLDFGPIIGGGAGQVGTIKTG